MRFKVWNSKALEAQFLNMRLLGLSSCLRLSALYGWYSAALLLGVARCDNSGASQAPLLSDCNDRPYQTHLISEDPLVIYIDGFISQEEALQLVTLR